MAEEIKSISIILLKIMAMSSGYFLSLILWLRRIKKGELTEAWFSFFLSSSVKGLSEKTRLVNADHFWKQTYFSMMISTDQLVACSTPSQIKIKRIQIKLHLKVSSLKFVLHHLLHQLNYITCRKLNIWSIFIILVEFCNCPA